MSIFDIIYLDNVRVASLASQRLGGISEVGTESRVVSHDASKSTAQASGGDRASLGSGPATNSTDIKDSLGHALQRAREIRFMDHGFISFLESIDANVVNLPDEREAFMRESERALDTGAFVRATGSVFVDDFAWISSSTREMVSFLDLQAEFSTIGEQATLDVLKNFKATNAKQRQELDEQRRIQNAAILTAKAGVEAQKKMGTTLANMVERVYGDQVELGVALGTESPRILVRGLLNRDALREPMTRFIDRYGMRSRARFSILGTVARLGWYQEPDFSEEQATPGGDGSDGGTELPTADGTASVRPFLWQFQAKLDQVRRMIMAGGGATSIFVIPLAIYRTIPLEANTPT